MARNAKKHARAGWSWTTKLAVGLILLVLAVLLGWWLWQTYGPGREIDGQLEVHVIDVGQGDSILVRCGKETMLVDAGLKDAGDDVAAYLRAQGIRKLDRVVITHDHNDHRGGLQQVLQEIDMRTLMLYDGGDRESGYLLAGQLAGSSSCEFAFLEKGQQFSLGEATVKVIFPRAGYGTDDLNDASLVLLVECAGKRVLLTGDSTAAAELLYYEELPRVDVLKVAHHGSGGSNSTELLQRIKPRIALISCGTNNEYGHPHKRVLRDLQGVGAAVYRTDRQGNLVVTLQDGRFRVKSEK